MSDPGGRGRSMRLLIEPMHNSLTAIVSAHALSGTPRPRRTRPVSITRRRSAGNDSGTHVPVTACRAWVAAPSADSTRSLPAFRSSNKGTGGGNLRAGPHPHADDEQRHADECRDDTSDEDADADREQMRDGQPEAAVRADGCCGVGVHDDQAIAAVADLPVQ